MRRLFSLSFWVQTLISTLVTMACIYAVKKVALKYSIPVVSTMAEEI